MGVAPLRHHSWTPKPLLRSQIVSHNIIYSIDMLQWLLVTTDTNIKKARKKSLRQCCRRCWDGVETVLRRCWDGVVMDKYQKVGTHTYNRVTWWTFVLSFDPTLTSGPDIIPKMSKDMIIQALKTIGILEGHLSSNLNAYNDCLTIQSLTFLLKWHTDDMINNYHWLFVQSISIE